jgi:hypothetical protein
MRNTPLLHSSPSPSAAETVSPMPFSNWMQQGPWVKVCTTILNNVLDKDLGIIWDPQRMLAENHNSP